MISYVGRCLRSSELQESHCYCSILTFQIERSQCFCRAKQQHHEYSLPVHLSDRVVTPASSVRNLGAYFNESMDMSTHVNRLVNSSFYQLRRVRAIRCSIPTDFDQPSQLIRWITFSLFWTTQSELSTPGGHEQFLKDKLHWLRVPQSQHLLISTHDTARTGANIYSTILHQCHWGPVALNTSINDTKQPHLAKIQNKVLESFIFGCRSHGVKLPARWY